MGRPSFGGDDDVDVTPVSRRRVQPESPLESPDSENLDAMEQLSFLTRSPAGLPVVRPRAGAFEIYEGSEDDDDDDDDDGGYADGDDGQVARLFGRSVAPFQVTRLRAIDACMDAARDMRLVAYQVKVSRDDQRHVTRRIETRQPVVDQTDHHHCAVTWGRRAQQAGAENDMLFRDRTRIPVAVIKLGHQHLPDGPVMLRADSDLPRINPVLISSPTRRRAAVIMPGDDQGMADFARLDHVVLELSLPNLLGAACRVAIHKRVFAALALTGRTSDTITINDIVTSRREPDLSQLESISMRVRILKRTGRRGKPIVFVVVTSLTVVIPAGFEQRLLGIVRRQEEDSGVDFDQSFHSALGGSSDDDDDASDNPL